MHQLEIYHYGHCGQLDKNNPYKLFSQAHAKEILYHIGKSTPYTLGLEHLSDLIDIEQHNIADMIEKMIYLDLIRESEGLYKINFTTIYEKDLHEIDHFSKHMAMEIAKRINESKHAIIESADRLKSTSKFSVQELLYHIIGSYILDGIAIDTLCKKGYFKTSKKQVGHRDYILFGFEKSKKVDAFSENILCSCNNYRTEKISFVSFGDAAGERNDFYRFNRQVSLHLSQLPSKEETKNNYLNLVNKYNEDIANHCADLVEEVIKNNNNLIIKKEESLMYARFLSSLNYLEENSGQFSVSVPIFYPSDRAAILAIHDILIEIIEPVIQENFMAANKTLNISAVQHEVDIKEILNEMWHQVFGNVNEELVKMDIIKKPDYIEGEGRYLKAIYLEL